MPTATCDPVSGARKLGSRCACGSRVRLLVSVTVRTARHRVAGADDAAGKADLSNVPGCTWSMIKDAHGVVQPVWDARRDRPAGERKAIHHAGLSPMHSCRWTQGDNDAPPSAVGVGNVRS
jgi:hypothetical protein